MGWDRCEDPQQPFVRELGRDTRCPKLSASAGNYRRAGHEPFLNQPDPPQRYLTSGGPSSKLACIWWSLAILQTQVAAYLLHSPSPSDVSLTAACNPPPRVAAALVSAFAVRLHKVITARRLQSTSGQEVSRISEAGQPDSAIVIYSVEKKGRMGQGVSW